MGPSRNGVGHVLVIASLTSGIHWTVIKDDLRSLCPKKSKGPGRVDVDRYSCTVKMDCKEDAEHVYRMAPPIFATRPYGKWTLTQTEQLVTRGLPRLPHLRLLVHYTQTFENGRTRTMRCNGLNTVCQVDRHVAGTEEHFAVVQAWYSQYQAYVAAQQTPVYPVAPAYATPEASNYASPVKTAQPYMWQQDLVRTVYAAPQAYQYPSVPTSNYRISPSTHLPVNTSGGAVQTESRGIFIRSLPDSTTDHQLKKLLKQFGTPLKCELYRDRNNRPTGSATALFASAAEASIVVGRLDGHKYKGHKLKVRSDRETTSIGEVEEDEESPSPSLLIANGSTA